MKRVFTALCVFLFILLLTIIWFGNRVKSSDVTQSTRSKQAVEAVESPFNGVPTLPRVSPSSDSKTLSQNPEQTQLETMEPEGGGDTGEEYSEEDWMAPIEEVLASEAMEENAEATESTENVMNQPDVVTIFYNGQPITMRIGEPKTVFVEHKPGAAHPRPLTEEEKEQVRILDHRLKNDSSLTREEERALLLEIEEITRPLSLGSSFHGTITLTLPESSDD